MRYLPSGSWIPLWNPVAGVSYQGLPAVTWHAPQVVFAADEQHRRVWAEAPDLRVPDLSAVAQRLLVAHGETDEHHIRPAETQRDVQVKKQN